MPRAAPHGAMVGLGLRPEIAGDVLAASSSLDVIEVVAEACFASPAARREAIALSRAFPVVPHGVKLSLGSAEGIDAERARRLGALARELEAPVVTEHVAFVRAAGREIGHLTQVPFTREAVRIVARNVAAARRALPDVPLLLENTAWTFRWPDDEMDEPSFFAELVERTGAGLLLDLGNLYANARNLGVDPRAVLDAYPLEHVAMVHLAGGVLDGGFYFDTHAHAVPDAVFELLARLVARIGPVPVILERDDDFPAFDELAGELAKAREILREGGTAETPRRRGFHESGTSAEPESGPSVTFAETQAALARCLTDPAPASIRGFDGRAIARTRQVLQEKRVDDAMPLLSRLSLHRVAVRELARHSLADTPRAPTLAGVADAVRIAVAATREPSLSVAARADLLTLRGRFVGPMKDGSLRPRVAPFVGRERLPGGRAVWALKGPGAEATLRLFETRS